jgi:hypothetical protein
MKFVIPAIAAAAALALSPVIVPSTLGSPPAHAQAKAKEAKAKEAKAKQPKAKEAKAKQPKAQAAKAKQPKAQVAKAKEAEPKKHPMCSVRVADGFQESWATAYGCWGTPPRVADTAQQGTTSAFAATPRAEAAQPERGAKAAKKR